MEVDPCSSSYIQSAYDNFSLQSERDVTSQLHNLKKGQNGLDQTNRQSQIGLRAGPYLLIQRRQEEEQTNPGRTEQRELTETKAMRMAVKAEDRGLQGGLLGPLYHLLIHGNREETGHTKAFILTEGSSPLA